MKNLIFLLVLIIILSSCGNQSPEEELAQAEGEKEELEELLQTETVQLERNAIKLETLENEISQAEASQNDENVQMYIDLVEEYSSEMVEELDELNSVINESEDGLDAVSNNIDSISQNIYDAISSYDSAVSELDLNETLMRRHNSLELAHADFPAALEQIKYGADNDDYESFEEGVTALNNISEFY